MSKNFARFLILVVATCATVSVAQVSCADSPREHLSFDANWKFHLGDDWPDALHPPDRTSPRKFE